ncbi:hypothetical protein [Flavihumibacter sp.]|uniref:hypothetical protein n=1 Tax=Flavihumibacter sp. TaxID=1913981 RepID=UPI002FC60BB4|nr:hypothetical protein [Flavihumibacter sediminis]
MKKVFAVLAIAAAFTACNDAAETTEVTITDSSAINATLDSAAATVNSASAAIDSTVSAAVDTINAKVDSLKK